MIGQFIFVLILISGTSAQLNATTTPLLATTTAPPLAATTTPPLATTTKTPPLATTTTPPLPTTTTSTLPLVTTTTTPPLATTTPPKYPTTAPLLPTTKTTPPLPTTTKTTTTPLPTTTTTTTQFKYPPSCTDEMGNPVDKPLVVNPKDCSEAAECNNGTIIYTKCPSGLFINLNSTSGFNKCVLPEELQGSCGTATTTSPPPQTTTTSSTYTQHSTPPSTMQSTTSGYYSTSPPPTYGPRCPDITGDVSICLQECSYNFECLPGQICCPTNCGTKCTSPRNDTVGPEDMPQLYCPDVTYGVSSRSAWLCEYIKWKVDFFGRWLRVFNQWRSENYMEDYIEIPRRNCENLQVTCINPWQQRMYHDMNQCHIPYCADGQYKCGPGLAAWKADKILWSDFFNLWKKAMNQQQQSSTCT